MNNRQDPPAQTTDFSDAAHPRLPQLDQAELCRHEKTIEDNEGKCREHQ